MQLAAEELRSIVEPLVRELIAEFVQENELKTRELSLIERVIRVEEELKALREVQNAILREMHARFEAVDKRFEAMEKRLNFMQWFMGVGFALLGLLITIANFLAR
jgi:uncharacterized membrane protein